MAGTSIRIDPLNADNYDSWKLHMRAILIKADLWSYASGAKPCPTGENAAKWKEFDQKACADITLAISSSELGLISECETSYDMWRKLESTFQSKGPARKATLLKHIALARMKEGDNIREHLNEFFHAVTKLKEINVTVGDDLLTILLLYSLPDSFETFRCALETRDELPKPDVLRVKILEEEQSRKAKEAAAEQNVFNIQPKFKNFHKQTGNASSKNKLKVNSITKEKVDHRTCYKCGEVGHISRNCRSKQSNKTSNWNARHAAEEKIEKSMLFESALYLKNTSEYWCIDSGCSSHMSSNKKSFTNFKEISKTLSLANNDTANITGIGNVRVIINEEGQEETIKFEQVMYVPDLRTNLLSVSKITEKGFDVTFKRDKALILEKGKPVLTAKRIGDLYYIKSSQTSANISEAKPIKLHNWHIRMGHLNETDLKRAAGMVHGMNFDRNEKLATCEICVSQKQTQESFPKQSEKRTTELLEIVHSDVCGPMRTCSHSGAKYFVTFTDDFSRYSEVYFMKRKSDVLLMFKTFKNSAETFTGKKIKLLQSDNGLEYINSDFQKYLDDCGIRRRLSAPYTPQQNGIAERKNRTLLEMSRCMLAQANLPPTFWAEAINTANYIRNRCPTKVLTSEVPLKLWSGKTPTVVHLRPFGAKCYVLIKGKQSGKFDPRSEECILVGYSNEAKAYRLWSPKKQKILVSRDVRFLGEMFHQSDNEKQAEFEIELEMKAVRDETKCEEIAEKSVSEGESEDASSPSKTRYGRGRPKLMRTGVRGRPRKIYQKAVSNANEQADDDVSESSSDFEDCEYVNMATCVDPVTLEEAFSSDEAAAWELAVENEFIAQISNETWDIVEQPSKRKVIGNRFVFRTKEDNKKKARLVAKGCSQRPGEDFNVTYSPVTRLTSIRTMAALAADMNLQIHQMDVITAYLNGDLDESVYMQIPEYMEVILKKVISGKTPDIAEPKASKIRAIAEKWLTALSENKNPVCKLRKSLYGLRQSSFQWYQKLSTKLREMGFHSSKCDPCFFIMRKNSSLALITVYVDDLLIATNDQSLLIEIKQSLAASFEMKDIGPVKTCLGIEFHQDLKKHSVFLNQREYTKQILKRFKMEECKPIKTPLEFNTKLEKPAVRDEIEMKKFPYQSLIGALLYLAVTTRPDLAFSINFLSQFNSNYNSTHWKAAKRVLRYLKGTINYGMFYEESNAKLYAFADADWGANMADRRSYSGYAFILAGAAISWEARKQRTVSLSSTESEYMALCETTREALYLRKLLNEIGLEYSSITIYNDSQSAQKLVQTSAYHSRTKHIDVRHHFIREKHQNGDIILNYMPTETMPADVLTKGLPAEKHYRCIRDLGMADAN